MQVINWKAAYAAFLQTDMTLADFCRFEMRKFIPEGEQLPTATAVANRFRELARAGERSKSRSRLVKVVGELHSKHVGTSSPNSLELVEKPVHIELPGGVKLSFMTQSPEMFAAQILRMAGGLPS